MNYKKSFLFIAAVLALMLCFSLGVAADPQVDYQDEVSINVPALEQYMDFPDATTVTVTDRHTGCYYVANVSWEPTGDQYVLPEKKYTVTVSVEAASGNEFTETVKAYINGKPANIIYKNAEEMKIVYTFPKLKTQLPSMFFDDVKVGDWFYESVEFVYYNHVMRGMTEQIFGPHVTTSRGMIVTVLYRMEEEPAVSGACPFSDVARGSYYEDAITWASENKIVEGYGGGKYGPDDDITREQLACIMFRFAKFKGYYDEDDCVMLGGFTDQNKISDWATEAAAWAVGTDLVNGIQESDGLYFRPQNNAERCQVATILERFCDYFNYYQ